MLNQTFDIIYLDPMFDHKKKNVAHKKGMMLFHKLVGINDTPDRLLNAALTSAKQRVIVKRPANAKPLTDIKPNHHISDGKTCRFDVYLKESAKD